ncbi:MAG: hypothetical protein LBC74_11455 [Planctomycetaceae bacterium]|nr:hypothetical protein [Planctomycetaceae bacterium]
MRNKNTPPRNGNNSRPSEESGMVSYRLSKRSITNKFPNKTKNIETK